jgi:hypothetical protein
VIPETKGVPLEELAAIFGDDDEVVVYMKDIHMDLTTHELIIDKEKGTAQMGRVATEEFGAHKHPHQAHHEEGTPTTQSEKEVEQGVHTDTV